MAVERDTRGRGDGASGHALGGASTTPSILFDGLPPDAALAAVEQPDCFTDLGLDQIVDGIVAGRDAYDLRPFFLLSAGDVRTVRYRQEVFQDLERPDVFQAVDAFGSRMRAMRQHRQQAERVLYPLQRQACWLESAERYCTAIRELRVCDTCSSERAPFGACASRSSTTPKVRRSACSARRSQPAGGASPACTTAS
jgi:hypothetical protein